MIVAVNASVLLLSHVIFQGRLVSKDFLTVQTLHTVKTQINKSIKYKTVQNVPRFVMQGVLVRVGK